MRTDPGLLGSCFLAWRNDFLRHSRGRDCRLMPHRDEGVIPAEAGIQSFQAVLDPRFRGGDRPLHRVGCGRQPALRRRAGEGTSASSRPWTSDLGLGTWDSGPGPFSKEGAVERARRRAGRYRPAVRRSWLASNCLDRCIMDVSWTPPHVNTSPDWGAALALARQLPVRLDNREFLNKNSIVADRHGAVSKRFTVLPPVFA